MFVYCISVYIQSSLLLQYEINHSFMHLFSLTQAEISILTWYSGMRFEYLVLFKQRPADVTVQWVSKVVLEVQQSLCKLVGMLGVVDGHDKQVDEPREWVLIHRVDVCQVSDAEEQNRGVQCDRFVAHTSLVNLVLSFFSDSLRTSHDDDLHTNDSTTSHKYKPEDGFQSPSVDMDVSATINLGLLWPWPLMFDFQNLIRSSKGASEYSQLFKPFMRHRGNNIWPD